MAWKRVDNTYRIDQGNKHKQEGSSNNIILECCTVARRAVRTAAILYLYAVTTVSEKCFCSAAVTARKDLGGDGQT